MTLGGEPPNAGERTPILVFDGSCGFCTAAVQWVRRRSTQRFRAVPFQWLDLSAYGLTRGEAERKVWWVARDGSLYGGHRAIGQALLACRSPWPRVAKWLVLPRPMSAPAAVGYRLVSLMRHHLSGTTPACDRAWDADVQ